MSNFNKQAGNSSQHDKKDAPGRSGDKDQDKKAGQKDRENTDDRGRTDRQKAGQDEDVE